MPCVSSRNKAVSRFFFLILQANKGNRKYLTLGAGFKTHGIALDAAYLIATAKSNPLDQTLRLSLAFDFDGIKDLFRR